MWGGVNATVAGMDAGGCGTAAEGAPMAKPPTMEMAPTPRQRLLIEPNASMSPFWKSRPARRPGTVTVPEASAGYGGRSWPELAPPASAGLWPLAGVAAVCPLRERGCALSCRHFQPLRMRSCSLLLGRAWKVWAAFVGPGPAMVSAAGAAGAHLGGIACVTFGSGFGGGRGAPRASSVWRSGRPVTRRKRT